MFSQKLSREDYKKAKELEELRKTGAAPPELDDEGQMINPHIPEYISKSPWYLNNQRPGLKHQKSSAFAPSNDAGLPKATFSEHYQRGKPAAARAPTKFVPGSCTNCGSTTHKAKECLERPRAKGAALTGANLAPADNVQQLSFTYDAKRDRWNGYDPKEYSKVIRRFEVTELERKKKKLQELDEAFEMEKKEEERKAKAEAEGGEAAAAAAAGGAAASAADAKDGEPPLTDARRLRALKKQEKLKKMIQKAQKAASAKNTTGAKGDESDSDSDSDADSDSDDELGDDGAVLQKKDASGRMTTRNLRIREDTAKYLRNLNPNSAHYDPKTRSMRENPYEGRDPNDVLYAGDNFVRKQGATKDIQQLQSFVWEAAERGNEGVHVQALPSQAEKLFQEYKLKKEALKDTRKAAILNKYGSADSGAGGSSAAAAAGGSSSHALPRELLLQTSEAYVEYDETGRVIKGQEKAVPRTKYLEDVLENGHRSIWGSYYRMGGGANGSASAGAGQWGYACCHQTIRHSICTGEAGKAAALEMAATMSGRASFKEVKDEADAKKAQAASAAGASASSAAAAAAAAAPAAAASASAMRTDPADDSKQKASKRKRRQRSRSRSSSSSRSSGSSSSGSDSDSSSSSRSDSSSSSSDSSDSDSDGSSRKRRSRKKQSRKRDSKRDSSKRDSKKARTESSSAAGANDVQSKNRSGYNTYSDKDVVPDEKDMEEYFKNKRHSEDPMNNIPSDRLLEQ